MKFITPEFYHKKREEFLLLYQGHCTMEIYFQNLIRLPRYNPAYETNEEMKLHKFIMGLNDNIMNMINIHDLPTIQRDFDLAKRVENNMMHSKRTVGNNTNGKLLLFRLRKMEALITIVG